MGVSSMQWALFSDTVECALLSLGEASVPCNQCHRSPGLLTLARKVLLFFFLLLPLGFWIPMEKLVLTCTS